MSEGLDLTAAVEAGARATWEGRPNAQSDDWPAWEDLSAITRHDLREDWLPAIAAAAPLIEAQVRESIAREMPTEAELAQIVYERVDRVFPREARQAAESIAARIARGPKL